MKKFRDRSWVIRFLIAIAFTGNIALAVMLTIATVIVDPSVLYTFGFWFEFATTLLLGYSSLALSVVLAMENTRDTNNNYEIISNGIIRLNKDIISHNLTEKLKQQVIHDNTIRKLKKYLVKCDDLRKSRLIWRDNEFWSLEYKYTIEYLKAYENANISELEHIGENFNLDSKKVRYVEIKDSALLTGRQNSNDEDEIGINTFAYVLDKKLPFIIIGSFVTIILAIITWQLAFTWEGMTELLGKLLIIAYNVVMGYVLGIDIIESYHITQMNKVRLYLQRFIDNNKESN